MQLDACDWGQSSLSPFSSNCVIAKSRSADGSRRAAMRGADRSEGSRPMDANRRDFIKISLAGGAAASFFGFDLRPAYAQLQELKIARAQETRSLCPYCAVGCGVLIYTIGDSAKNVTPQVIHVEGDPDHPTNRGTLVPQGSFAAPGHPESAPAIEAAGSTARWRSLGRYLLGSGAGRNRASD